MVGRAPADSEAVDEEQPAGVTIAAHRITPTARPDENKRKRITPKDYHKMVIILIFSLAIPHHSAPSDSWPPSPTTVGTMVSAFLHPFAKPTRTDFVSLVRGEGSLVFDSHGKEYIDAMASLWYCAVGHGRREIAEAIKTKQRPSPHTPHSTRSRIHRPSRSRSNSHASVPYPTVESSSRPRGRKPSTRR